MFKYVMEIGLNYNLKKFPLSFSNFWINIHLNFEIVITLLYEKKQRCITVEALTEDKVRGRMKDA